MPNILIPIPPDASNRLGGSTAVENQPLIVNGGPELHRSNLSLDDPNSDSAFPYTEHRDARFPHIQIRHYSHSDAVSYLSSISL